MYENEAEIYRALGDPVRLRILALLRVREACVCELVARLPVSQPAVSQHLRKLRQAGLLSERRQKYWTYYAIRSDLPPHLAEIVATLPQDVEDEAWLRENHVDTTCAVVREPAGGAASGPEILEGEVIIRGR
ncbi:MAG: metalloregulator ArsR/SmtB family transcription factor [Thermaerobacter sp.]|nr:metalloregulator ArsR/SmtB family transcription factor [Thermaerobacter sp.]